MMPTPISVTLIHLMGRLVHTIQKFLKLQILALRFTGNRAVYYPRSWILKHCAHTLIGLASNAFKRPLLTLPSFFRAARQNCMKRHWKTCFPAANVSRLNEDVSTDTLFSDTPAHDDGIPGHGGCTMVQVYTGIKSHLTAAFPMKRGSQIPQTLLELLLKRGAPNNLKSDNAKVVMGNQTQDILQNYCIGSKYSEPLQRNQNQAKRRIQDLKNDMSKCMDRTKTPEKYWLVCLLHMVFSICWLYRYSFFFFKQKTAYEIRNCDWSSDVCSSDLERDR